MSGRRLYLAVNGKVFTDIEQRDAEDRKPVTSEDLDYLYAILSGYEVKTANGNGRLWNDIRRLLATLDQMEE